MPSTVSELFIAAGLTRAGVVPWGTTIEQSASGVYVVATSHANDSTRGTPSAARFSRAAIERLLGVRAELTLDLARPTADDLIARLGAFWLADEAVLYIGRAKTLRSRVNAYYATPLGAARPHAGGWWLKTLSEPDGLWVHWAATPGYQIAEKRMLRSFTDAISSATRGGLPDSDRAMPFANLVGHDSLIKRHGIAGARGELPTETTATLTRARRSAPRSAQRADRPSGEAMRRPVGANRTTANPAGGFRTQPVTEKDYAAGRVRLPRDTKTLLPDARCDVIISVRGEKVRARWDPKFGPPERSGVLSFGKGKVDHLLDAGPALPVIRTEDGQVQLG